jgi:hypothetical protein
MRVRSFEVSTVCTGTIRERWLVTAPDEETARRVMDGEEVEHCHMTFVDQTTDDEEGREVTEVTEV